MDNPEAELATHPECVKADTKGRLIKLLKMSIVYRLLQSRYLCLKSYFSYQLDAMLMIE